MLKLKRFILLISLFLVVIITSGCEMLDEGKKVYDIKKAYVAMIGEIPTTQGIVDELFYLGERDIKYHLMYEEDRFIAEKASATANLAYNISYILNTPAKLIHNIRYDYKLTQEDFKIDENVEKDLEDKIGNSLLDASMVLLIIMDIFNAVIGLILSIIMLFIGTFVGLIAHPIDTFLNIPSVLWGLIKTVFSAVVNIFSW